MPLMLVKSGASNIGIFFFFFGSLFYDFFEIFSKHIEENKLYSKPQLSLEVTAALFSFI
jgi:hypothetical protein